MEIKEFKTVSVGRKRMTRRQFLGGAAAGALALGGAAALGWRLVEGRERSWTSEQHKAAFYFSDPSTEFVENIVAVGQEVGGKDIVRLRNRPYLPPSDKNRSDLMDSKRAGEERGRLERGQQIAKAIVVWGDDQQLGRHKPAKWYAFPHPESGEMVFAYELLFEYKPKLYDIKPIDLSKPLPILKIEAR